MVRWRYYHDQPKSEEAYRYCWLVGWLDIDGSCLVLLMLEMEAKVWSGLPVAAVGRRW